jgi:hypothetical protein
MVSAGVFCAVWTASTGDCSKTIRDVPLGVAAGPAGARLAYRQPAPAVADGTAVSVGYVSRERPIDTASGISLPTTTSAAGSNW